VKVEIEEKWDGQVQLVQLALRDGLVLRDGPGQQVLQGQLEDLQY
jgi:hypothetical protein